MPRFEHHARNVSLLTMVSRVSGLARDATLSRLFGVGLVLDAFFFAFMIPNLFRRLFGEGALAAAFLPVYSRLDKDDPSAARALASLTIARLVVVLGMTVVVGELVLYLISARADHEHLAVWLMMVMLPYMPLVCMVAILGAMLHVHGRFGPTAAAPIVLNCSMIAAAIGAGFLIPADQSMQPALRVGAVAVAVVLAGVIQVAWSLWALRGRGWWSRSTELGRRPFREVLRQAGPMIVGLGVLQLNTFFDGLIASYPSTVGPQLFGIDYPLQEGAMTSVSFAQRLYQFPLGVFGLALATAIFPALVSQAKVEQAFIGILRRGLRLVVFIGLPASAGLILVRKPLVEVVLQGGRFTADDVAAVSQVLLGYASAVWAYSMVHVLTRGFYASGDSRTPVGVAVKVVALNLLLNVTLIWTPLREAGLAWSTAICAVIQVALLMRALRRGTGRLLHRPLLSSWGKTMLLTAVMVLVVGVVIQLLPAPTTWLEACLILLTAVILGAAVIVLGAMTLRMPELKWAVGADGTEEATKG